MNLGQIDLSALPGLDMATGLFGSVPDAVAAQGDRVVEVMVIVYESVPPETLV